MKDRISWEDLLFHPYILPENYNCATNEIFLSYIANKPKDKKMGKKNNPNDKKNYTVFNTK